MATSLPPAFIGQMKALLADDFDSFEAALHTEPPVSIRLNRAKTQSESLQHLPLASEVPWHPDAWYLAHRPSFTLDPLFHAGAYYVQEASSMLLRQALEQSTEHRRPLRILDLCAAPGGKTTLIASWMPEGSVLVANEVIKTRVGVLKQNLVRWGNPHVFTCSYDPEAFLPLAGWFDVVVTDAPCSGEGLFRKNDQASHEWSEDNVTLCAARQRRILQVAQKLIAPRGTLIYSTCTYNTQENDANVDWLMEAKGMQEIQLTIPDEWGATRRKAGYQMYPHKASGEGFYIAALRQLEPVRAAEKRKREFYNLAYLNRREDATLSEWIGASHDYFFVRSRGGDIYHAPKPLEHDLLVLDHLLQQGVWLHETGQWKGSDFVPSHALALQCGVLKPNTPSIALTTQEALLYLKKELTSLPEGEKGWSLVTTNTLPLGWIRNLGNRFNNYYPTEQRIRIALR